MPRGWGDQRLRAALAELLVDPGIVSLGRVDPSQERWTADREFAVKNVSCRPLVYQLSVDAAHLPWGSPPRSRRRSALSPAESGRSGCVSPSTIGAYPRSTAPRTYTPARSSGPTGNARSASRSRSTGARGQLGTNNDAERAAVVNLSARRTQVVQAGRPRIDSAEAGAATPDEDWFRFDGEAQATLFAYVDASEYRVPFFPSFRLYDTKRKRLQNGQYVWGDEHIVFFTLPYSGTYYLRVSGRAGTEGPYRLSLNLLPPEVRFVSRAPPVNRANHFLQLRFTGRGAYILGNQVYDRLSQFRTDGGGTPDFRLNDSTGNGMLLDAALEAPVVVTVVSTSRSDELWSMEPATARWTREADTGSPGGIVWGAMAYAENRSRTVLFGGYHQELSTSNKTWEWDGNAWTEMQLDPTAGPSPRQLHRMVYDSDRGTCVLFGGIGSSEAALNDTWEYDGRRWISVPASGPPRPQAQSPFLGLAFDKRRKRTVLVVHTSNGAQTWEYDGLTDPPRRWSKPRARRYALPAATGDVLRRVPHRNGLGGRKSPADVDMERQPVVPAAPTPCAAHCGSTRI